MTLAEFEAELEAAKSEPDEFPYLSEGAVASWKESGSGFDAVPVILRFMEANPSLDYGVPGPLARYAESFKGQGYESELTASVQRNPVPHTVWMLNRLINDTADQGLRVERITMLEVVLDHPLADEDTCERAAEFLQFQRQGVLE